MLNILPDDYFKIMPKTTKTKKKVTNKKTKELKKIPKKTVKSLSKPKQINKSPIKISKTYTPKDFI